jgi:predicted GIY-YIG superfamily endonuclease
VSRRGVYLLHAMEPIGNPLNPRAMAQHYIGYGDDLERRIADQLQGNGHAAALPRAFRRAGVAVFVARVWPGAGRDLERRLKRRKKARAICPACRPAAWERPA